VRQSSGPWFLTLVVFSNQKIEVKVAINIEDNGKGKVPLQ